jgi:hypothetical protein
MMNRQEIQEEAKKRKFEILHYVTVLVCGVVIGWFLFNQFFVGEETQKMVTEQDTVYYYYEERPQDTSRIILTPPEELFDEDSPETQAPERTPQADQSPPSALDWFDRIIALIETITPIVVPFITYFLYRKEKQGR